ncbi:hypothetical protein LJK87_09160 [Paenibacillus sp. P25]|nr:hypothetical protein LJK87_09160 [Paenibacillus sp. P25]
MALWVMMMRKMVKNKWLELSLLLGLVISVGLAASMPIYTGAILQRSLIKDLELLQSDTQQYPGVFWASAYASDPDPADSVRKPRLADEYMTGQAHPRFQPPVGTFVTERATDRYKMLPADPSRVDPNVSRSADLVALSGMEEHVKLVDGEWPKPEPVNGVYEVLVVEDALANFKMVVGNEFTISDEEQIKRTDSLQGGWCHRPQIVRRPLLVQLHVELPQQPFFFRIPPLRRPSWRKGRCASGQRCGIRRSTTRRCPSIRFRGSYRLISGRKLIWASCLRILL